MITRSKIVSSFAWKLLERFLSQAISLTVTIFLARILLPEEFGIIAILLVFIELANVIIDGGLCTALIQKKDTDDIDFSTITYFGLALAITLYIIFFYGVPFIAHFYDNDLLIPVLRVLSLNLIFNSFNAVQRAYISKHMLFNKLFYCNIGATIASGATGILMAYKGFGVWALVGQQIVGQVTLTFIMWFTIKWRPLLVFSPKRFRPLFDYGWKILLSNMIICIYENIRSLIIGKIYLPTALAYFDRGKQFPSLIMSNVNTSLQTVLLPSFADIQDNKARVKQLMKRSIELTNFIILPLLTGLLVMAEPLVRLILTDVWIEAVPFLQIFCIAFMTMPIQSSNMSAIKALGYSSITLKIEIIKKILETIILIISFCINIYAVAWGIVVYNFICIAINLYPCKKLLNYGIIEQIRDTIPYAMISAIMGISIYGLSLLECPIGWLLIGQIVLGLIVYISLNALTETHCYIYIKNVILEKFHQTK